MSTPGNMKWREKSHSVTRAFWHTFGHFMPTELHLNAAPSSAADQERSFRLQSTLFQKYTNDSGLSILQWARVSVFDTSDTIN